MANPVVHFEIHGSDSKRQTEFYSSVFDWEANADNPQGYALIEKGAEYGIGGGLTRSDRAPAVIIYVEVDEPQATLDKVSEAGGTTVMPVNEIEDVGVTIAIFADPDGNNIGLVKTHAT